MIAAIALFAVGVGVASRFTNDETAAPTTTATTSTTSTTVADATTPTTIEHRPTKSALGEGGPLLGAPTGQVVWISASFRSADGSAGAADGVYRIDLDSGVATRVSDAGVDHGEQGMVSAVSEGAFVVDSGLGRTTVSPDGKSLLKTGLPGEQSAAADAQGMWRLDRNGSVLLRVRFDSGEVDRSFDLADAWFGSIHRGVAYLGAPDGRAFTLDLETGAIAPRAPGHVLDVVEGASLHRACDNEARCVTVVGREGVLTEVSEQLVWAGSLSPDGKAARLTGATDTTEPYVELVEVETGARCRSTIWASSNRSADRQPGSNSGASCRLAGGSCSGDPAWLTEDRADRDRRHDGHRLGGRTGMNQPTERSMAEAVIERRRASWPLIIGAFAVLLAVIVIGRSVGGGGRSTSPSSSTLPPTTAAAVTSSGPELFETSTTASPTTIGCNLWWLRWRPATG